MDKQRMTPSLGGTQSSQIHSDRRVAVKMANFIMYISSQLKFKKKTEGQYSDILEVLLQKSPM